MFKDHFSDLSSDYARFRPVYPEALFDYLADKAPDRDLAWDCATGTGQAARSLVRRFRRVYASDASAQQIQAAGDTAGIEFHRAPAERSGLADTAADLICVAQALHWFDLPRFYAEARRVLKPEGLLAVWSYGLLRTGPAIEDLLEHYYRITVGPYWPPERRWIDTGYRDLDFPFSELETPEFAMRAEWNLDQLLGYLGTWSAGKRYRVATGRDPLQDLRPDLARVWGDAATRHTLSWPLFLRLGKRPE